MGIPLANALGGAEALPYTSLATSVCVPVFNILAVVVLTVFSGDPQRKPSIYQALSMLANVASPLMLFILGARFDFKQVSSLLPQIILGVLLRLVICPVMVLSVAVAFRGPLGLTALEMPTVIAVTSTPVAVSSAVMVREISGDDQLAGQLVVWTSLISIVSVFCIVFLCRMFGLL